MQKDTGFDAFLTDYKDGFVRLQIEGERAKELFKNETGGHRWQRVPPTETRGRVHTSTITVAVLDLQETDTIDIKESDLYVTTTKGSGPGGQHRNKTETCVIVKHMPTGVVVRCETERSQYQNKFLAIRILKRKIKESDDSKKQSAENSIRQSQIGSGERGDKIRTYRVKDDRIIDHRTGKKFSLTQWMRGKV